MSLPLDRTPAWLALEQEKEIHSRTHLTELFAADPERFGRFSLSLGDLLFDFSKQRISETTLARLLELAEARGLAEGIRRMTGGDPINNTEGRAVLHMALRGPGPWRVAGKDVTDEIVGTRQRMYALAEALRTGGRKGATGQPIRHLVNIGIGGSDLGPRMAARALSQGQSPLKVDFVANVDPAELEAVLATANPAETFFVVSSKTFNTVETLSNASAAREWLVSRLGADAVPRHFAAVSNNVAAAGAFGIPEENLFPMAEWVGGRYSMWSAIGLPLAAAIGSEGFEELLAGAGEMDAHFRQTPFARNLPVIMGLLGIWNTDFLGAETLAVLPYAHRLADLPAYLQQLEMESNGKRVTRDGLPLGVATSPVLWGGTGTVGQHAYHQLLYQGTRTIPADFIVVAGEDNPAQRILVDNALAQSAALMAGKRLETAREELRARGLEASEVERLAPHMVSPGNQPSSTLLLPELTPRALGRLIALFEHKVFVQGWIWGINSFDQYGVELGKQMARNIDAMRSDPAGLDGSTRGLMAALEACRG